jgi:hypothetical protein
MNVQLIESLVQVILAATTHSKQFNHADTDEQILQPLIAAGRIIPPAYHPDIPAISEADLKVMVSNIQISGKPLSETIIEERGEW